MSRISLEGAMICATCGTENEPGRKFCGECGARLTVACPACDTPNAPGTKFCGECGTLLAGADEARNGDQPARAHEPVAERRLVSVLFADLVGFTTLSESRDAEEVRELLTRYFDTCRELVTRYGGVIEKFIGDAVMAVWGAPTTNEDDAERAVRAALDLTAAVAALGEGVGLPALRARAGVLSGEAAVTLGAKGQGMVAGDLVNTASRIQSAAQPGTVLVGRTLIGSRDLGGPSPALVSGLLAVVAVVGTLVTIVRGLRLTDPFLDPRLFRSLTFSSAALVSLLTGYAFATAIIGGAVFVDRVLYGGPDQQRFALGALAASTAVGALVSGFAVRFLSLRLVTLVGLAMSAGSLVWMARWTPQVDLGEVALALGIFGLGFGLTVTPRSTAAVEVAGRASFGMASATVTVARMIGMAIGVAVLTAYGSTTIDRLYDELFAVPDGWKQVIPAELRERPLRDGLVVEALERWAANEASTILIGLFVAAGVVTLVAIPPGLALGRRAGMLASDRAARGSAIAGGPNPDGSDERRPTTAL